MFKSITSFLHEHAQHSSDKTAFNFISETQTIGITYAELDKRARAIAATLQHQNALGERAMLFFPPGLEYIIAFLGCLYAGVIAIPAYPPRNNRYMKRLQSVVDDAQAKFILTNEAIANKFSFQEIVIVIDQIHEDAALSYIEVEIKPHDLAFLQYTSGSTGTPKGVMISHENIVKNIESMGENCQSTDLDIFCCWLPPYHDMGLIGGILAPIRYSMTCYLMSPNYFLQKPLRWLQAISRYHATLSLAPNFAYALCADTIVEADLLLLDLSSWRVAFNGAEPISADVVTRFCSIFAKCGFTNEAIYPNYGMAETTLMCTGAAEPLRTIQIEKIDKTALAYNSVRRSLEQHNVVSLVGCGVPLKEHEVIIVDTSTLGKHLPLEIGEIWVRGPCVAQGYWNKPMLTKEMFDAHISGSMAERPFFRTGDLGFLNEKGHLFITGRLKDILIIRGKNLYPQDIETTVAESDDALIPHAGVAFMRTEDDSENLVVVQEIHRHAKNTDHILENILRNLIAIDEVMPSDIILIRQSSLPKTSSGKVQRRQTRQDWQNGELQILAHWQALKNASTLSDSEESLAREHYWFKFAKADQSIDASTLPQSKKTGISSRNLTKLLRTLTEDEQLVALEHLIKEQLSAVMAIPIKHVLDNKSFPDLGGSSLLAVQLVSRIRSLLGLELSISKFFEAPTIKHLAYELLKAMTSEMNGFVLADRTKTLFLSYEQERLWFLCRLNPESMAYHIPSIWWVEGPVDVSILSGVFHTLIERHEILRTGFEETDGVPRQFISKAPAHKLIQKCLSGLQCGSQKTAIDALIQRFIQQPFDLEKPPLIRTMLIKLDENRYVLAVCQHHIISDGWSFSILAREFTELYAIFKEQKTSPLQPLLLQYADYVHWQRTYFKDKQLEKSLEYWKIKLADMSVLSLPADYPRPLMRSSQGEHLLFDLGPELSQSIYGLAKAKGVSVFMVLLASLHVLLSKLSGQSDIGIGSPVANRYHQDTENMLGFFANTVVFRAQIEDKLSFSDVLEHVKQTTLEGLQYQMTPFELVVNGLNVVRDLSHNPLFDVMLAFQYSPESVLKIRDAQLIPYEIETGTAMFDLTFFIEDTGSSLKGTLEYCTALYKLNTISRWLDYYRKLLTEVCAKPHARLSEVSILSAEDYQTIIYGWNDTKRDYANNKTIAQLFAEQVARTPNNIALVFAEVTLTYAQLNNKANQLAHYLRAYYKEVAKEDLKPDTLIIICLERSLEMVIGILGVIKAGAAYVPLDPEYPQSRMQYMLEDSQAKILFTHDCVINKEPTFWLKNYAEDNQVTVVNWSNLPQNFDKQSIENPVLINNPNDLVSVFYTSGSTGQPKGVMNIHEGLVNRLTWMQLEYQLTETDRVLQKTPFSFDVSVWEFFWPLFNGASLIIARPKVHHSPIDLAENIERYGITVMHFVPSMLLHFVSTSHDKRCESLRLVFVSGEALSYDLQKKFIKSYQAKLHNLYGPTEASIDVTSWACHANPAGKVLIGKPISNTAIYVLDNHRQPVPIGTPGELYIGGAGLARGYLNRPALTAEKFIPNPFSHDVGARLYRTGDLVRFLADGNIEYIGRIDYQIKLRGFRIELGEIEHALLALHAVRQAVVLVQEKTQGNKQLVAYLALKVGETPTAEAIQQSLKDILPQYMVPTAFIFLETMPLNVNGKVDRKALALLKTSTTAQYIAPRSELEKSLVGVWQTVLGVEQVGIEDNFFELGGNSLLATQVISIISRKLGVQLSLQQLFQYQTIEMMAKKLTLPQHCNHRLQTTSTMLTQYSQTSNIPLSFVQERFWVGEEISNASINANTAVAITLKGKINYPALHKACNVIIARHNILRTVYSESNGVVLGNVLPQVEIEIPIVNIADVVNEQTEANIKGFLQSFVQKPLDFNAPLLHCSLIYINHEHHIFVAKLHHMITDGWSNSIYFNELGTLYNSYVNNKSIVLPPLDFQYEDFVIWQKKYISGDVLKKLSNYWEKQLYGVEAIQFPTRKTPAGNANWRLTTCENMISAEVLDNISTFCQRKKISLFTFFISIYQTCLYHHFNQTDFVIGTPFSGRHLAGIENLMGCFINALPIRCKIVNHYTFDSVLEQNINTVNEAFLHHDIPFSVLANYIDEHKDRAGLNLYKIMYRQQEFPAIKTVFGDIEGQHFWSDGGNVKCHLAFEVHKFDQYINLQLKYDEYCFSHESMVALLDNILLTMQYVLNDSHVEVGKLRMMLHSDNTKLTSAD